jgi:hypothetical protein
MGPQPAPYEKQEAHADGDARNDRNGLVLVECGQEETHDSGDAHEPDGQAPKERTKPRSSVAKEEDRNRSEAGGKGRDGAHEGYDDDFGHARPYPV